MSKLKDEWTKATTVKPRTARGAKAARTKATNLQRKYWEQVRKAIAAVAEGRQPDIAAAAKRYDVEEADMLELMR